MDGLRETVGAAATHGAVPIFTETLRPLAEALFTVSERFEYGSVQVAPAGRAGSPKESLDVVKSTRSV